MTRIADWTTLRLGGPAGRAVEARSEEELVAAVLEAPDAFVLAGGSNVVVADAGFPGSVIRVLASGISEDGEIVSVAAGEPWDPFVARMVASGRVGVECLAGIPGSVGATPIQNVGAYGQDVAETIVAVRALERSSGSVVTLSPAECGFAYRSSAFKRDPGRWVVLSVDFRLPFGDGSAPIRYAELARTLGVSVGASAPLEDVRQAVLGLRRRKGMVLDAADHDTWSAGSFFTNPIVDAAAVPDGAPAWPEPDGRVKTSAAWLIERAGFARGEGRDGGIAISSKHVLALTNRGGGTTEELVAFAERIAGRVRERFGIALVPEPVFVGVEWPLS